MTQTSTSQRAGIFEARIGRLTKRVASGGAIVLLGQILARGLSFGLQLLLSNVLGARSYGLYSLGMSLVEWSQQISQFGLANALVRFVAADKAAKDDGRVKGTILSAFLTAGALSMSSSALLILLAPLLSERYFGDPTFASFLRWMALSVPLMVGLIMTQAVLRGFQRIGEMAGLGVLRSSLYICIAAVLFELGARMEGAVASLLVSALVAFSVGVHWVWRAQPQLFRGVSFQTRRLFRFSVPVYLAAMSFFFMSRVDILMVGYFLDPPSVGHYRAAVTVASLVNFMLGVFNTAFAPMISELYQRGDHKALRHLYQTVTRWVFTAAFFACIAAIVHSGPILSLFGPGFSQGATALAILAVGQLVNAGVGSVGFFLQMTGRQDWVLFNNAVNAALNVMLNLWLTPMWGLPGAALATGLSLALNNVMGLVEVWRFHRVQPWNSRYWPIIGAGIVAIGIGVAIPQGSFPWPLLFGLMAMCFVGTILVFGLGPEDRLLLEALKRRLRGRTGL